MREPFVLSLHLIEVSHISTRKSSITLRYSIKNSSEELLQIYEIIRISNLFYNKNVCNADYFFILP